MKSLSFTLALTLAFFATSAQFENIDLSEFKLPDIKRHQLDFDFSGESLYMNQHRKEEDVNRKVFDLETRLNAEYFYFRNTDNQQTDARIRLISNMNLGRGKYMTDEFGKDDNFYSQINMIFDKRYYPKRVGWFYHVAPTIRYSNSIDYNLQFAENNSNFGNKSYLRNAYFDPEIELGGGFGRIEPVGDLRRAIYILEKLQENNRLEHMPGKTEIFQLAKKVAELRNQRFFDSRLRQMYEIKSLDSTLNNLGLIEESDAVYFVSLNDMWQYGQEDRQAGTRVQFDLIGRLNYNFNKTKNVQFTDGVETEEVDDTNWFNESIGGMISLVSYKPIGLKWQRSIISDVNWKYHFIDAENNNYKSFNWNFHYGYKWYLNTRTTANFTLYQSFNNYYDYDENEEIYSDHGRYNSSIVGSIDYYFSPRLSASMGLSLYYVLDNGKNAHFDKYFYLNNHINIQYAIF